MIGDIDLTTPGVRMQTSFGFLIATLFALISQTVATEVAASDYAIVVSQQTRSDAGWNRVVAALEAKHNGRVIVYDTAITEALLALVKQFPQHVCFVATRDEATREFVAQVHRLTRQLDEDPYTDCLWGILTGYDASNALRIAEEPQALVVKKVASGTEIALDRCSEGVWFSELKPGLRVRKTPSGETTSETGAADSTRQLANTLTTDKSQLFVTSGHATERDWQIGFAYRNGQFVSKSGQLFGVDVKGERFAIESNEPRVYLAVGNCLMGHIDGPDAMALAFLNSAGVRQMVGYTVLTWYGYAGWGCLDYYIEQPGRYTLAEAFFANQQALLHRLDTLAPELLKENPAPGQTVRRVQLSEAARAAGLTAQDLAGLLHDRDVLAFYGDPAWSARLEKGELAWGQSLTEVDGVYTFEVTGQAGDKSFAPVNTNGSQRGGRPIIQFLPKRLKNIRVLTGTEWNPVLTDNFLLMPLPKVNDPSHHFRVTFRGEVAE